ncbi:MAG: BlaI/MecI/CopY family transcriptional regulator, partial [Acetatifactor sp.]|nr:BlaI/MecI/CopY family transcriptional regulator [Acetatifactor sp.]
KSTPYPVPRRVCQKGILQNEGGRATSRMSRAEYESMCSEWFLQENFGGSLPRFLAAFMGRKKLSQKQIEEIQRMIDSYEE